MVFWSTAIQVWWWCTLWCPDDDNGGDDFGDANIKDDDEIFEDEAPDEEQQTMESEQPDLKPQHSLKQPQLLPDKYCQWWWWWRWWWWWWWWWGLFHYVFGAFPTFCFTDSETENVLGKRPKDKVKPHLVMVMLIVMVMMVVMVIVMVMIWNSHKFWK